MKSRSGPEVMAGLMLVMALAAMDNTIVGTAIPTIVRDLGGFASFPWIFSIYLLAQAVTIPLYGKLADLYGRKPVLFAGVAVFLLGSALSGLAGTMWQLIIFRGLQGIGAGAVQPIAMTIVGDLFTVEERARMQGVISSVWGISSVIGPSLGGFLVQYASWRWIFYVNLPIGLLALLVLQWAYHEDVEHHRHRIDFRGAAILTVAMGLIQAALLEGGATRPWTDPLLIAALGGGVLLTAAFVWSEARAPEPVLPLWVFSRPSIAVANITSIAAGALTVGISSFLPTFVEGIQRQTPTIAGFVLAAMSVGWPLASSVSGRFYLRFGFRPTALAGLVISLLAGLGFFSLTVSSGPYLAGAWSFGMGVGLGFTTTSLIVAIQSAVPWRERGVATGSNMFMRMLGSTLGVAVMGSILNSRLATALDRLPSALRQGLPPGLNAASLVLAGSSFLSAHRRLLTALRGALYQGMHGVFGALAVTAALGLLVALRLPSKGSEEAEVPS